MCTRLEEVVLSLKILQLGKAETFLASIMDPPNSKAVELALTLLRTLNALDEDEKLTPLGYHLAQLPLDPRTGKEISKTQIEVVQLIFTTNEKFLFNVRHCN